jgi:hypothetical protein
MKTWHEGRMRWVLFALLLAAATVGHKAQAATVTYVGAEVSSGSEGWGTEWNTGTRSSDSFKNPAPGIASVTVLGWNESESAGLPITPGEWRISSGWGGPADDASVGIGVSVADQVNGVLFYMCGTPGKQRMISSRSRLTAVRLCKPSASAS